MRDQTWRRVRSAKHGRYGDRACAGCPDRELFEKLVQIAESGCIMVNTLKGKIDLDVRIVVAAA